MSKCFICGKKLGWTSYTMCDFLGNRKKPPNGMKAEDEICSKCIDSKYGGLKQVFDRSASDAVRHIINYEIDYSKLVTTIDEIIKELDWEIHDGNISDGHVEAWAMSGGIPCRIDITLRKQTNSVMVDIEFDTEDRPAYDRSSSYFTIFLTLLNQKLGYNY